MVTTSKEGAPESWIDRHGLKILTALMLGWSAVIFAAAILASDVVNFFVVMVAVLTVLGWVAILWLDVRT